MFIVLVPEYVGKEVRFKARIKIPLRSQKEEPPEMEGNGVILEEIDFRGVNLAIIRCP